MTSQMMTLLGAVGAMLAFLLAGLPSETPLYLKLVLGVANAGLTYYLGQTNTGTVPPPPQRIDVRVEEKHAP